MAINVGKDYGAWKKVGGELEELPLQSRVIKESSNKYAFSFSDAELLQITTPDLYIVYGDVKFKEHKMYFRPTNELPDMVKLRFTLSGNGSIYNQVNKRQYIFNSNQQNIIYMPELDGTGEYDTTRPYQFFEVHFAKERFLQLAENSNPSLQALADHLDAGQYSQLADYNLPVSWAMKNCIYEIINCNYTGSLKLAFIDSKCIELLVLQAEAFEKARGKTERSPVLAAYDQERIYHAREYLVNHLDAPPSITELAKICGINEFKLKQGFKGLFDRSIFGYLTDYKLNYARELLLEGTPIKAVAFQLGYSSVPHFSNAFRKKFAVSPGKLI
ncbi:AraC family transcriptional activator of pyochelin receptor [Pedobacter sp. W3I1]|uniref:helix-turn-helix transcriptional regulator n=1 Tax=Pedobacter sp. W3I1 TaxID=3042291 RepID=UPI0027828709|nr:AraC family transcriptional regulator [Pedobacter sp. W3I1]MDQ0640985.1 AraC family transcriptional activator of pyochelin receptor [Pedobacter sp. W3I1]